MKYLSLLPTIVLFSLLLNFSWPQPSPSESGTSTVTPFLAADDDLADPSGELTDIIVNSIRRIAHAPRIAVFVKFHMLSFVIVDGVKVSTRSMPKEIYLIGELDDENQHVRVLKAAHCYCANIIDFMTIKKS